MPFTFVGRLGEGDERVVFLARDGKGITLKKGEAIDATYRLVDVDTVTLLHIPTGQRQPVSTQPLGSASSPVRESHPPIGGEATPVPTIPHPATLLAAPPASPVDLKAQSVPLFPSTAPAPGGPASQPRAAEGVQRSTPEPAANSGSMSNPPVFGSVPAQGTPTPGTPPAQGSAQQTPKPIVELPLWR